MKSLSLGLFIWLVFAAVVNAADTIALQGGGGPGSSGRITMDFDLATNTTGGLSTGKMAHIVCNDKSDVYTGAAGQWYGSGAVPALNLASKLYVKATTTLVSGPTGGIYSATMEWDHKVSTLPLASPLRLGKEPQVNLTVNRGDMVAGNAVIRVVAWCVREQDGITVPMQLVIPGGTIDSRLGRVNRSLIQQ